MSRPFICLMSDRRSSPFQLSLVRSILAQNSMPSYVFIFICTAKFICFVSAICFWPFVGVPLCFHPVLFFCNSVEILHSVVYPSGSQFFQGSAVFNELMQLIPMPSALLQMNFSCSSCTEQNLIPWRILTPYLCCLWPGALVRLGTFC